MVWNCIRRGSDRSSWAMAGMWLVITNVWDELSRLSGSAGYGVGGNPFYTTPPFDTLRVCSVRLGVPLCRLPACLLMITVPRAMTHDRFDRVQSSTQNSSAAARSGVTDDMHCFAEQRGWRSLAEWIVSSLTLTVSIKFAYKRCKMSNEGYCVITNCMSFRVQ